MSRIDRRNMLKLTAAGLAGAGVYKGLEMSGILPIQAQQAKTVDAGKLHDAYKSLGKWIYLTPQKLGGGTHAVDMSSGITLAWISYWNYGDTCPISHHLAAYPSEDPYKGFEFVNSTQGGENVLIYGIPTRIKQMGLLDRTGQGNHIYRVRYNGQQMELMEDVAESTGIGLGVHTTIFPDANGFAGADGQKDICAFFDRAKGNDKTKVLAAFRADWVANNKNSLEKNWSDGGTLRLTRLTEPKETGKYEYEGTTGNKINWEMVPMAEALVWRGQIPGESPQTLAGLDAVVHHPGNRYSALVLRMPAAAMIIDRTTWEPACCLHMPEGSPGNLPVKKVASGPDVWEVKFDDCKCVAHEAGFSPDGKFFTMMNNIQQNNMPVFDSSDPDPRKWKKFTFIKDPKWVGEYPSPFHLCFSMDGSKMFVSVLYPKPTPSSCVVVDTKTWKIIKKFENIGPDCQTMAVTYDGKYVLQIFSGFQRLSSGLFIFTQDTLEPVGYQPNFGGHHDCVIVPTKVEHLKNSRCTTL
jgi:thiocyanate desulfurase